MFNALRSDELLVGIGHVLRSSAAVRGPLEDFERTQMLSASSVARLLAAEQRAQDELLAWLTGALREALGTSDPAGSPGALAEARLARADSGAAVGEAVGDLLDGLPADDPRRPAVQRILGEMADREVAALADLPA